jgi:hypothetical protein
MASKYNIIIEQGADFGLDFAMSNSDNTPIDLTGAIVRSQIREKYSSPNPLVYFTGTVLDGPAGTAKISLTASQTSAIAATDTNAYVYDIEVAFPTGSVVRILEGNVAVSPEVTR